MPKLVVFNSQSVDGYFTDKNNDMSWAHSSSKDPEYEAFEQQNATGGGMLLFGRKTYELMASYWPTPAAAKDFPVVAERMNSLPKVVFSRTLDKAAWNNTRLVKDDAIGEIRKLKQAGNADMAILGSGTIVSQLAEQGLVDEYQIMVTPVVLGEGRTMFDGVSRKMDLKVTKSRSFGNGKVFVSYEEKK